LEYDGFGPCNFDAANMQILAAQAEHH
jgi:hypothetical protein